MRRSWILALFGLLLAAIGALVWETRRLAELAGRFEAAASAARRTSADLGRQLVAEASGRTAASAEAARLTAELATATAQLQGITTVLTERTEQFRRVSAAAEAAQVRSLQPMSEGVRACLASLHECLRAEGFASQRFVQARRLDADGLHEVEMFDLDGDGLGVTFVTAGRMEAELDRSAAKLVLRFFDGHRFVAGERQELPAEGWPIVFQPVDGRVLEQRLPYLLRCAGSYPEAAPRRPGTDVDPNTRRQWLERLDQLLAEAGTAEELRITRFRGMADGFFLEVELVGTDARHRVLSSAHVARMAVEIDEAAGVVSLLLRDGVLRNDGIESTISGEGYRMLLPKLDKTRASDLLFGMVVKR